MILFPAVDIIAGRAVRLTKGDYDRCTVYGDPVAFAREFTACGASHIHLVDLEGARDGGTPNYETVLAIRAATDAYLEIGGGIRNIGTAEKYLSAGVNRVILGTAAIEDEAFLREALRRFGDRVAVGADVRDGKLMTRGWMQSAQVPLAEFCRRMENLGVDTLICTDISRDGLLAGSNREMYRAMLRDLRMHIVASGGVSTQEDLISLRDMGLWGAIVGKAYYTGAIDLSSAVALCEK